jgi:geranylgeranyl diphosphate synthase type II
MQAGSNSEACRRSQKPIYEFISVFSKMSEKHFIPLIQTVEEGISASSFFQGNSSPLERACRYALEEGKRFRPAIVLAVAEAVGKKAVPLQAALAIEYFHTASLIADDLPCMDNDAMRRGRASTHKVFGESVALLASYALIAAGYEAIGAEEQPPPRLGIALMHAARLTGVQGATGGQYLDLFPSKKNEEEYEETAIKKTVSLFELAMILGWVYGGGDIDQLSLVQRASIHYGLAFQIADDFEDEKQDETNASLMNAQVIYGKVKARQLLQREIEGYLDCLEQLRIDTPALRSLTNFLNR